MSDIIGLDFKIRGYANHFAELFESLPIEEYTWHVDCSENFYSHCGKVDLFLPNGVYSGSEFKQALFETPSYYIHLIRLLAVPNGIDFNVNQINTYDDYVNSPVEIAFLSGDSIVDLYIKSASHLNRVYELCKKRYASISLLTEANDTRTEFWV